MVSKRQRRRHYMAAVPPQVPVCTCLGSARVGEQQLQQAYSVLAHHCSPVRLCVVCDCELSELVDAAKQRVRHWVKARVAHALQLNGMSKTGTKKELLARLLQYVVRCCAG